MKKVVLLLLSFCFSALSVAQNNFKKKDIHILPQSQLTITGDTNISAFSCIFNPKKLPNSILVLHVNNPSEIQLKNAILVLNNEGFDCGNKQINKDFHSLLQTEEYPEIRLEVKKIRLEKDSKAKAEVNISIAGKQNQYSVPVRIVSEPATCFEGSLELDINDFGLEPPKKLFGMIKVKEDIQINFNLSVEN